MRGDVMGDDHGAGQRTEPTLSGHAAETIQAMVRRIVEFVQPERVILFGSYASGVPGPDSDVDLLVVLRDGGPKRPTVVALYRLLAGMGLPKDIVVATQEDIERFKDVPGTIIWAALRQGKVLHERSA